MTRLVFALFVCGLLSACEEPIAHYRVKKEPREESPSHTATAGFHFTAPTHWRPRPADPMRKASFRISGEQGAEADVSVTSFPGNTGGLLANVNRWRGQIGLPPIEEKDLLTEKRSLGGHEYLLVEMSGNKQRIVAAILPRGGETWFFKVMGEEKLTTAQKPAFLEFLNSVHFE